MASYQATRHWRYIEILADGRRLLELDVDPSISGADLVYIPDEASWQLLWPDVPERDEILRAVRAALPPRDYEYHEYQVTPDEQEARRFLEARRTEGPSSE